MDSPINPNTQDLEDIEKDLAKDKSNKKFYVVLTALIIALVIIAIGVVIIVLRNNKNKEEGTEPKEKEEDSKDKELKWEALPNNEVYQNFECQANENTINVKYMGNMWNTPPRNTSRWKEGFQDMNVLVGYPQLKYDQKQIQCTVTVFTKTAIDLDLTYEFNGIEQKDNSKVFTTSFKDILKIKKKKKTGEVLELEDVDFIWNSEPLATPKYDTKGKRGAIVEMYGWKDKDIEKECEFIGKQGYMGVKVFPHHEQLMSHTPFREQMNPWYFMYQPVSYSLNGRLGTRNEFRQMIKTP